MSLYLVDGSEYKVLESRQEKMLRVLAPGDEVEQIIREATASVEAQLALEDAGWVNLSSQTGETIPDAERILNLKLSRLYSRKDPLGKQSIRLWTDYTFGTGMTWDADDESTKNLLTAFWDAPENKNVLSPRGQRKSSNKLLIDGEVFFAIFLGAQGKATIRFIDPLEITEIITDLDDKEDVKFYKRVWSDAAGHSHITFYRSYTNIKHDSAKDAQGADITSTDDAIVYHLADNTVTLRGNPLLLPALDWMKQYRRFLASRIAVMLALARFAWRTKVKGGQAVVDNIKAQTHEEEINAGSQLLENLGSDTTPIKTESGAQAAYRDGKMIQHQVFAAVGIPEQYFGDISTGNLATAKTVELPMLKMFQSFQALWRSAYQDINEIVLAHAKIAPDKWYVDMVFPPISLEDVAATAKAIVDIVGVFPQFADSSDVQQLALITIGINDPAEVLKSLEEAVKSNPSIALTKALKQFREVIKNNGKKGVEV